MGRLSRPPELADTPPDRGALLRTFTEELQRKVEAWLRKTFLKEVYIVHGPPTKEALAGKRPAINLALHRLAAPQSGPELRVGFIVSAWSNRPEEEHELLGVVLEALQQTGLKRIEGRRVSVRVQDSYDFELLHRFWSSHAQPVRASVVLDTEIT